MFLTAILHAISDETGIPLALIYLICTFLIASFVSYNFGTRNIKRIFLITLTLGAMFSVVSYYLNKPIKTETEELVSEDIADLKPIKPTDGIAFLDMEECSNICKRLLINNITNLVAIPASTDFVDKKWAPQYLDAFYLEREKDCKDPLIVPTNNWNKDLSNGNNSATRVLAGTCLRQKLVSTDDIQNVVSFDILQEGNPNAALHRWDLTLNDIRARRISVFQKSEGTYLLKFQKTEVITKLLDTPLMIGANGGYGLNLGMGFLRTEDQRNLFLESIDREYWEILQGSRTDDAKETAH